MMLGPHILAGSLVTWRMISSSAAASARLSGSGSAAMKRSTSASVAWVLFAAAGMAEASSVCNVPAASAGIVVYLFWKCQWAVSKGAANAMQAIAEFKVTQWDQTEIADAGDGPAWARATVLKTYTGGLEGESRAELLLDGKPADGAGYIAQ